MSKESSISKNEYEILAEFRYVLRKFINFSKEAVKEAGITPQQHQALLAIKGYPRRDQITVGELAERLQVQPHSAVGLANRLEAENLIYRSAAENDHRKVFLSLTGHGLSILEKLSHTHREELHRLSPQLRVLLEQIANLPEDGN